MEVRPIHHFTPPSNWMNDPNGLIHHDGIYHLYYQHNPLSNQFGNISWGHATSHNLINWEHHPIALRYTNTAMIYSGCTVVNKVGNICAIYTEHVGDTENYHEQICLAESQDGGYTFDQENRKVILKHTTPDFRDPKVFWHDESNSWIMCVALPKEYAIHFYRSDDLLNWTHSGSFTSQYARGQFWECPDLFPLEDEKGSNKWILSLSGVNADGKTWGMFYFIGEFDGSAFTCDQKPQPMDYGSDYYAGITFEGITDRIMLAWAGNWAYAGKLNEELWSGVISSPRKLILENNKIVQELITKKKAISLEVGEERRESFVDGIKIEWSREFILIDRSSSERNFPSDMHIISLKYSINKLVVFLDHGLVECVLNGGEVVLTFLI